MAAVLAIAFGGVQVAAGAPVAIVVNQTADSATYELADTWRDREWRLVAGRYRHAADISSAPDATLYVLDTGHEAVHVLAPDGTPLSVRPLEGVGQYEEHWWFSSRLDVGYDGTVAILLATNPARTFGRARVDLFNAAGVRVSTFTMESPGGVYTDIAVAPNGTIYLTRTLLGGIFATGGEVGVDVFQRDGTFVTTIDDERLTFPTGVDVAADGTVYVINQVPSPGGAVPPGPTPTPYPSLHLAPDQDVAPVEGILVFSAAHAFVTVVPFSSAEDVAAGRAGVFVSRHVEIFKLGEREPLFTGPTGRVYAAYFGRSALRLDVPTDGRLLASVGHCYFQGVAMFADPAARPADATLTGELDSPPLRGPVYPIKMAADRWLSVMGGRYDIGWWEEAYNFTASHWARELQTAQHWSPDGQLLSQLGLCSGQEAWWVRDLAVDGDTVYTVDAQIVHGRPDNGFPAWRTWPGELRLPDGNSHLTAVAADNETVAVLDIGAASVVVLDDDGAIVDSWGYEPHVGAAPADIAMAGDNVYVAEQGGHRVARFGIDGAPRGSIAVHDGPVAIATGPTGSLFVLGRSGWGLRYSSAGELEAAWRLPARAARPLDIAVDSGGQVFVNFLSWQHVERGTYRITDAGIWVFHESAAEQPLPNDPSGCLAVPYKSASPGSLPLGGEVGVTLRVEGRCPGAFEQVQLALLVDTSRSMTYDDAREQAIEAGLALLSGLDPRSVQVTLATFDEQGGISEPLTTDHGRVAQRLAALDAWGDSRLGDGIQAATAELFGPASLPSARKVIVILTDGIPRDDPSAAAEAALALGVDIYIVVFPTREFGELDRPLLDRLAGHSGRVIVDPGPDAIEALSQQAAPYVPEPGLFQTVTITDVVPSNMTYIAGSAVPPATFQGNVLTWQMTDVAADVPLTMTYRLRPQVVGTWPTNVRADADFLDALGNPGQLRFPVPQVFVWDRSHLPFAAYLPVGLNGACVEKGPPVDVVLVLDTSGSMSDPASEGATGTKLDAARGAARRFLDLMAPTDQAAIVSFDITGRIDQPLTANRVRLGAALDGLEHTAGTQIDQGLARALEALTAAREGARTAVILLTDGRHGGESISVLIAAAELKNRGALIFTIGLGDDADLELLRSVATSTGHAFHAPDARQLEAIYEEISARLPCGP